jgi:hypothetical protein
MDKLPAELIIKSILKMEKNDIDMLCKSNKYINRVCKANKDYIYRKLLKRDYGSWVSSPEQLYNLLEKKIELRDIGGIDDIESHFFYIVSLIDNRRFDQIEFLYKLNIIDINIDYEGHRPIIYLLDAYAQLSEEDIPFSLKRIVNFIDLGISRKRSGLNGVLQELLDMRESSSHNFEGILDIIEYVITKADIKIHKNEIDDAKDLYYRNMLPKKLYKQIYNVWKSNSTKREIDDFNRESDDDNYDE